MITTKGCVLSLEGGGIGVCIIKTWSSKTLVESEEKIRVAIPHNPKGDEFANKHVRSECL